MLLCHPGVYLEFLSLVSVLHMGQSSDMRDKIIDRNSLLFSVLLFYVSLPQCWARWEVRILVDFSYCSSVHYFLLLFFFPSFSDLSGIPILLFLYSLVLPTVMQRYDASFLYEVINAFYLPYLQPLHFSNKFPSF